MQQIRTLDENKSLWLAYDDPNIVEMAMQEELYKRMIRMKKTYFLSFLLAISLGAFAQGVQTKGFAVMQPGFDFQAYEFTRHACTDNEIQLDVR